MTSSPCPWPTLESSTTSQSVSGTTRKHPGPTSELQPRPVKLTKCCASHASSSAFTMQGFVGDDRAGNTPPEPGSPACQKALAATQLPEDELDDVIELLLDAPSKSAPNHIQACREQSVETFDGGPDQTQPQDTPDDLSSSASSENSYEEEIFVPRGWLPLDALEFGGHHEALSTASHSTDTSHTQNSEPAHNADFEETNLDSKPVDPTRQDQSIATLDHFQEQAQIQVHSYTGRDSLEIPTFAQPLEGDFDVLMLPANHLGESERSPNRPDPPPPAVGPFKEISESKNAQWVPSTTESSQDPDVQDIAGLVIHTVGGRSFCSRAVTCDILTSTTALHSTIVKPDKTNPFDTLPPSITSTILEYACGVDVAFKGPQLRFGPSDEIPTCWIHDLDFQAGESRLKAQGEAMRTLSEVCRLFRCMISPWKWHTIRANLTKPCSRITSGLKYPLPNQPAHIESGDKDASDGQLVSDWKRAQSPEGLTIGHLVKHLVIGLPLPTSEAMGTWLLNCPNLLYITFVRPNNANIYPGQPDEEEDFDALRISIFEVFLKQMANYIPMSVQSISGLHLPPRAAVHNPPGVSMTSASNFFQDNIINLLNYARNLHTLSLSNTNFTGSYGQRILFVMTLNFKLSLAPVTRVSGDGSASQPSTVPLPPKGITNLDLGPGSIVDLGFMNGLKTAAPDLTHFHLQSGSTLNANLSTPRDWGPATVSTTSTGVELNLKEFLTSFCSRLKSFSFVCSVAGSTTAADGSGADTARHCSHGILDDVTRYCQNLEALHITSDLITFNFFENLSSEEPTNPPLKLRYLRIQFDHHGASPSRNLFDVFSPPSPASKYVELRSRRVILDFAKVAMEIKSSGIEWPSNSCWSRRDLLTRIKWLVNERVAVAKAAARHATASLEFGDSTDHNM